MQFFSHSSLPHRPLFPLSYDFFLSKLLKPWLIQNPRKDTKLSFDLMSFRYFRPKLTQFCSQPICGNKLKKKSNADLEALLTIYRTLWKPQDFGFICTAAERPSVIEEGVELDLVWESTLCLGFHRLELQMVQVLLQVEPSSGCHHHPQAPDAAFPWLHWRGDKKKWFFLLTRTFPAVFDLCIPPSAEHSFCKCFHRLTYSRKETRNVPAQPRGSGGINNQFAFNCIWFESFVH